MTEKLYPERQRCKKCSKKLDKIVLDGLFCSYRCGSFPEPYAKINEAPRGCKTEASGEGWKWKRKFRAESEIPKKILDDPSTSIYRCEHCRFLHIGHQRALGNENARLLQDAETLGSVLLRIREQRNQTRKDVAAAIKTRPVRLKEIEEAAETIDSKVLFKLLQYYRVKLNILF